MNTNASPGASPDPAVPTLDSPESTQEAWVEEPGKEMLRLADAGQAEELEAFVSHLSSSECAHGLSHLDEEETERVLALLRPDEAAELIRHLPESQAALALAALQADKAAAIVHELPSDEQADVLGDLEEEYAEAILNSLPSEEAASVRELTAYEDDVAGGLMVSELMRFTDEMTVANVITQLSQDQEKYDEYDIRYGYVCDRDGVLIGVLPMSQLLFEKRSRPIDAIMIRNPLSVIDTTPLDQLIEFFDTHEFLGVPVVDQAGVLKGVVHREAVDYATVRATESDYLKSQGIVGGEELRTMPLWLRSRRRLSWLSINILLNIGAASVIALFQDTLKSVIALAVFLPIISDMSGCSGNQAVAVSMRELSLGVVRPTEMLRVWLKEISVGLINGSVLGLLVGVVAMIFDGNPYLGLVIGVALFANTLVAVSIGGTVPLLLKRLGVDPAVASGPLLTTITDMCGFFFVLGTATVMLSKLTS
jgi:magnesium transporter